MLLRSVYLIFFTLLLGGCSYQGQLVQSEEDDSIKSYRLLNTQALNLKLKKLNISKENPAKGVFDLFGLAEEQHRLSINQLALGPDDQSQVTVTVMLQGYADDSVRGEWYELVFKMQNNGEWLITNGKQAFQCWRGDSQQFQKQLCP